MNIETVDRQDIVQKDRVYYRRAGYRNYRQAGYLYREYCQITKYSAGDRPDIV
jgi:hypothetical protein